MNCDQNLTILFFNMNQSSPFYPTITRVLELISSNNEVAGQIHPHLLSLKEELQGFPLQDNIFDINNNQDGGNIANVDELSPNDRRILAEVKETMTNQYAIQFLERVRLENHLTVEKMRQLSVTIANKCGIQTDSQQFRSIENIYRWFDDNWEQIEPFTSNMQIVNCDSK